MATKSVHPRGDNEGSLGVAAYRWATAFIAGVLSNGTESKTIKQIADEVDASASHRGSASGHADVITNSAARHTAGTDQGLDTGGASAVTAAQAKAAYTHSGEAAPHSGHVDSVGNETIAGEKTFSTFPITPLAPPDANYEVANKKYVDDTVAAGGGGATKYIPFEMRFGVPVTNLELVDIRMGRDGTRNYVKRIGIGAAANTTSYQIVDIMLPADFVDFLSGEDNIFLDVYSSDRVNNTITLTVEDDTGGNDAGVDGLDIEPSVDATWEEMSGEITGASSAGYQPGEKISITVTVNLDLADYYWIGMGYLKYVN